jgi:PST family polysaccharide transporter
MLWVAWGKVANGVLQLLILAALARLLSPSHFGVVSAALIVINLSGIVSNLGLGPALVQRPEIEPRHIETAFTSSVLLGLLLGALVWWGAPAAGAFFHIADVTPVLRALAWVFALQGFGVAAESLLRRELRFRWLANLDVVTYGVGYGAVGITLAALGWGVWALVAGQMAQTLLKTVALVAKRPPRLHGLVERRAFSELLYFGGGFTLAKVANHLALWGDNLVVGRFLGPAALGLYGRAYQLMAAPASAFGTVLDSVLFPAMARVQSDPARLTAAYRRGVALIALAILPVSAALVILAPEAVHVLLGRAWTPVVAPFQVLAIGMLFRTSYKMSDSLARATGAVYRRAWRQGLYAALVIGGAWIGQHWSITGVALGVLAAVTINFLLMAQLSLSVSGLTWSSLWQTHVPGVLVTGVAAPLVWLAATLSRHWGLPPVAVVGVGAGVLIGGVLLLVRLAPRIFLGPDGVWMLDALRSFAPKLFPTRVYRTPDAQGAR